MFTIKDLVQPDTMDAAYRLLVDGPNNTVLGGCAFLRIGSKQIDTAIDLSKLNLDTIREQADYIEVGAMATFRMVETHPGLRQNFNGLLPKAVGNIIGVQFRNVVTVGASVYAKYGFSDLITALLALDTDVELYKAGRMPLAEFLDRPYSKDILVRIFIKKDGRRASYQHLRNSASDYPILNVAVAHGNGRWTVVAGARPLRAKIAGQASEQLSASAGAGSPDIDGIAATAAAELDFGSNLRGTGEYRRAMCQVLVKRAIEEVIA
ncbi:Hypothetical protein LUCI_5026 [Lucifera butyrica]|uniref:FAD-binding PCMH-type domain-containing protein n=1 Tax=Lucifera butyrica TaxID=1351585 RepID=A0A498RKY9_9FIRM|nr:FAD binding domain-containing protein [Lucifera butyrica]VBB09728.1 Hypothetical protein LUCI_5026 [Lucifera butyrica]